MQFKRMFTTDAYRGCLLYTSEDNLAFTKMKDRAIVLKQDACAGLTGIYEKHVDVIFMDPPYDQEQERRVLEQLRYAKYVSEETLILVEASLHTDFSYDGKQPYL